MTNKFRFRNFNLPRCSKSSVFHGPLHGWVISFETLGFEPTLSYESAFCGTVFCENFAGSSAARSQNIYWNDSRGHSRDFPDQVVSKICDFLLVQVLPFVFTILFGTWIRAASRPCGGCLVRNPEAQEMSAASHSSTAHLGGVLKRCNGNAMRWFVTPSIVEILFKGM